MLIRILLHNLLLMLKKYYYICTIKYKIKVNMNSN